MKKLSALIMVLVLLVSAAWAEAPATEEPAAVTRTRTLELDGEALELTETQYTAEKYTVWYQADALEEGMFFDNVRFKPVGAAEDDESVYYMIVPVEITADQAEGMIAEATGGYDDEWTIAMQREWTTDAGNRILAVDANNGTELDRFYLVVGEDFSLCITAVYPAEDAEVFSPLFDIMTATIELTAAEAAE